MKLYGAFLLVYAVQVGPVTPRAVARLDVMHFLSFHPDGAIRLIKSDDIDAVA